VTAYLSGGELFDRIVAQAAAQNYSENTCAVNVRQMLSALQHLHDNNIVHRDLKPENFVFETKAVDSKLIMIDFGSALVCPDPEKTYKEVCGTPYYMPPEAVRNRRRNRQDMMQGDMFAIGVITYIMMSGTPPFGGNSDEEIFRRIKQGVWNFPKHVKWSEGLKTFVTKCLAAESSDRLNVNAASFDSWVCGKSCGHDPVDLQILGSLRKFVQSSMLQKKIVNLMVKNVEDEDNDNLKRMFRRLDKDNNDKISQKEIQDSLEEDGMYKPEAIKQAERIMKDVDTDGSGEISFDEFVRARARNKLSTDVRVLQTVFSMLDHNQDNFVDVNELREIFTLDGDEDFKQLVKEVDLNSDGNISYEEFVKALGETNLSKAATSVSKKYDAKSRAQYSQNPRVPEDGGAE